MNAPRPVKAALLIALVLQFFWHGGTRWESARARPLQDPPNLAGLKLASFGESVMASRWMMLYLQSADIQPGIIIPYRNLDYARVKKWLATSLALDERDPYPLLAATGLYLGVNDGARKRVMLDFVYRQFLKDPEGRWQWLARGALAAKYQLHDLPLALEYAEALNKSAAAEMPRWIHEMPVFILENMNGIESEKILIGGLLVNGKIRDPNEIRFLETELASRSVRQAK